VLWNRIGGAWVGGWILNFVPQLSNGAQSVTATVNYCQFQNVNGLVTYQGMLTVTGTGAVAQVQWTVPRTASNPNGSVVGTGYMYDASINNNRGGIIESNGATLLYLRQPGTGPTVTEPLAAGDNIMWTVQYRTTGIG
jgi:hypothetical protein